MKKINKKIEKKKFIKKRSLIDILNQIDQDINLNEEKNSF